MLFLLVPCGSTKVQGISSMFKNVATFHLQNMFETRQFAKNHSRYPHLIVVSACNLSEIFVGYITVASVGAGTSTWWCKPKMDFATIAVRYTSAT